MNPTRSLIAIAATLLAFVAPAQQTTAQAPVNLPPTVVGATAKVDGLVTVSFGTQVATVANESPVVDHSRYVTSSSGRVSLNFKDGCVLSLGPNQWVEVDSAQPCDKRIAMIQIIRDSTEVAGLFGGTGGDIVKVLGIAVLLSKGANASIGGGVGGSLPVGGNVPTGPTPLPGG